MSLAHFPILQLDAPIVPGRSAAGFEIGQLASTLDQALSVARRVSYRPGFNLNEAIQQNVGLLVIEDFPKPGSGRTLYFGPDIVRLVFSSDGRLGCIYLFDGYLGVYNGVAIGDPLACITSGETLEFDDGDEMYYRIGIDGEYIAGLAICAWDADPAEHESTLIHGYCVHDWSVFR